MHIARAPTRGYAFRLGAGLCVIHAAFCAGADQELRVQPLDTAHAPCRALVASDPDDPWAVAGSDAPLVIGDVRLDKRDIFDVDVAGEKKSLYRLANRLHVRTRDEVIRAQLLFHSGEPFDARLLQESERLLRLNRYFFDAAIRPVQQCGNRIDVDVVTREVWTLNLGLSLSRTGGNNNSEIEIEELNLLGTGSRVGLDFRNDADRRSTVFELSDRQLGSSWVGYGVQLADSSDGWTFGGTLERPFYALDARWAAGLTYYNDNRLEQLYAGGDPAAQYRQRRRFVRAYRGFSRGLQDGWVQRWSFGVTYDDRQFESVATPELVGVEPRSRTLAYPYVAYELLEDNYNVTTNLEQIGRSEDVFLGTRLAASFGLAADALGSDRSAALYTFDARSSVGAPDGHLLQLFASARGRYESGATANLHIGLDAKYSQRHSEKRLFFATASVAATRAADLNEPLELGGENGLRGFPIRYQSGDARAVVTLEQRYFTDWYPLRLARVGGAVFADAGRAWGPSAFGAENQRWLKDIGFGLRLAPTRSGSGKLLHLDIAFPIGAPDELDGIQISLESKRRF